MQSESVQRKKNQKRDVRIGYEGYEGWFARVEMPPQESPMIPVIHLKRSLTVVRDHVGPWQVNQACEEETEPCP